MSLLSTGGSSLFMQSPGKFSHTRQMRRGFIVAHFEFKKKKCIFANKKKNDWRRKVVVVLRLMKASCTGVQRWYFCLKNIYVNSQVGQDGGEDAEVRL